MLIRDPAQIPKKDDPLVAALLGETVIYSSSLATVTRNCVVVRNGLRGAKTIVLIDSLTGLKKSYYTTPPLLVIACGLMLIAAAAFASKQGLETTLPVAGLAALFGLAFVATRRAAVVFQMDSEQVESVRGSFRQASDLIRAVEAMRANTTPS